MINICLVCISCSRDYYPIFGQRSLLYLKARAKDLSVSGKAHGITEDRYRKQVLSDPFNSDGWHVSDLGLFLTNPAKLWQILLCGLLKVLPALRLPGC